MNPPVVKDPSQTSAKAEQTQAPALQLWESIRTVIGFQNQAPPLKPISRQNKLPLSFPQERLWLLEQLNPGSSAYNIPFAFRITGDLNLSALEQSIQTILLRHEALRTNFINQQGQPVQIVTTSNFQLSVIDLKSLSPDEQDSQTKKLITTTAQQPFDLTNEPLFRSQLLQLGEQEYILLLCIHHIVFDGWSQGILFQELSELYTTFCQGEPNPLQPLAIQYPDFSHWQRQWLQEDFLQVLLNYWQQNLGDNLRELHLPTDYPQPTTPTRRSSYEKIIFSEELTASLKQLSRQEGATLFATLLAAFQVLLWRYTQQEELFVCSPIANRNRKEIKNLIGYFVNLLILRSNLADNPSFPDLLKQVRQQVSGAYAHQDLPINCLDFLPIPLSQVLFTLQNTPSQCLELPNLGIEALAIDSGTADFDLFLSLEEDAGKLIGTLKYNTDLFAPASMSQMLEHFQTILEQIVANREQHLASLLPLSAAQQQELAQKRANRQLKGAEQGTSYVAPRNNLELRLKNIWEKILAVQPIGVKDDFLALGGKSLMAIRLLAEIQTEFDQKLSLINLLQAPTIEQMARLLAQTGYSIPWTPLVPIQEGGSKLPLFLVAPGATTALHFLDLARHLGAEQPVYAFHSKGLETDEVPHTTIEEIAAYYIEAMQTLDFDGPYLIGGRCGIGTVVAYEMAQQLLGAGKQVNLLVMLDPTYEAFRNAFKQPHLHFMEKLPQKNFAYYLNQVKLHWEHQELHKILWRKTGIPSLNKKLQKLFNPTTPASSSVMPPHKRRIKAVFRQHNQAANQYVPSKFPGKILLFLSDYRVSFGLWRYQNWHELATLGLERHIFPGHHSYLLREPQVQPLAARLKTYLDKAQEHPWWF